MALKDNPEKIQEVLKLLGEYLDTLIAAGFTEDEIADALLSFAIYVMQTLHGRHETAVHLQAVSLGMFSPVKSSSQSEVRH